MKGIDCATPISAEKAKELYANGEVDFIVRYYSHNPAKNLTRAEAQALSDAGLLIVTVWESIGTEYSFFTSAQGGADAVTAALQAKACGQPPGTVIYSAVDFDATAAQIDGGISNYFLSYKLMLGGQGYLAGSYGSPLVNQTLVAKGLVARQWRAQSTGWAGNHDMPADIAQGPEQTLLGIDVDTDTTEEAAARIGAWSLAPAQPVQRPEPSPAADDVRGLIRQLQAATRAAQDGIMGPDTYAKVLAWQEANS